MAPPSKRQKRNVAISSSPPFSDPIDDEGETRNTNNAQFSDSISSPLSVINGSSPASTSTMSKPPLTPVKSQTRATTANNPHNAPPVYLPNRAISKNTGSKIASASPEKAKGKGKSSENGKSGDILKLFSSQLQRQKSVINGPTLTHNRSSSQLGVKVDKDVYDISSDDDDVGE